MMNEPMAVGTNNVPASPTCPLPKKDLETILRGIVLFGATSVTLESRPASGGKPLATVASGDIQRRRLPSTTVTCALDVLVNDRIVATISAKAPSKARDAVTNAIHLAAERLREAWSASNEINNLAGEIVHNYEELHLLYEVGKILTSRLSLDQAANKVLNNILHALGAEQVVMTLEAPRFAVYAAPPLVSGDIPLTPDSRVQTHYLRTTLFGGGTLLGTLAVGRNLQAAPFASDESKLLDGIGTVIGNAIRNAQLWDELSVRAESELQSKLYLQAVLNNVADGVLTFDLQGSIETFNPAAETLFDYIGQEMRGVDVRSLIPALHIATPDVDDIKHEPPAWSPMVEQRETSGRRKNGSIFPLEAALSAMRAEQRALQVLTVRDLTASKLFSAVEHQALHDPLTGLPNRTLLYDRLHQGLSLTNRNGVPLAFLVLDLDRFKDVNDTLGHPHGDGVLREVALRIQRSLRDSDTVARWGGDEFAILLMSTGQEGAITSARKILEALEPGFTMDRRLVKLEASIGIALSPEHGLEAGTLIRRADVAMYTAKRARSRVEVFHLEREQRRPSQIPVPKSTGKDLVRQA